MAISSIVFTIAFIITITVFSINVRKIYRNINLGLPLDRSDQKKQRWKTMIRVALGQSKMVKRPVSGLLHVVVYLGFIIINTEVLEIIIDGITGSHRAFEFLGTPYRLLIGLFEVLALLVAISCLIFFIRRNIVKIKRFHYAEMKAWPRNDANIILVAEVLLMSAFLLMNASDSALISAAKENIDGMIANGLGKYTHSSMQTSDFWISQYLIPFLPANLNSLATFERGCWWFHIIGIFAFLNYLPYSKHFHIILAFPNVFYSNLNPKGSLTNMESVTNEVKLMFDPSADPYAAPEQTEEGVVPQKFGAKDVTDLTWKSLMDAYSCTECGRCSSSCPANQTGKLLSPRKIMMDTRDRLEEVGKAKSKKGDDFNDGKALLGNYIKEEEIWACTSCNACVDACPVNIDPLSIIIDLRRYLVMEESKSPSELTTMFTNIENNGAPWQFSQADRLNWKDE